MTETAYTKKLTYEGVPILQMTFRVMKTEQESLLNFLEELAKKAESWCSSTLYTALSADYSADPDPRRRFRHRSFYELDIQSVSNTDGVIELFLTSRLKTPNDRIEEHRTILFDLANGYVLPPRKNKGKLKEKRQKGQ